MAYKVVVSPKASKVLEKINEPSYSAIKKAIYALQDNHGLSAIRNSRGVRVFASGWVDYRVIYTISEALLTVDVIDVGNRKDIYD